jgi:hypothetical protein
VHGKASLTRLISAEEQAGYAPRGLPDTLDSRSDHTIDPLKLACRPIDPQTSFVSQFENVFAKAMPKGTRTNLLVCLSSIFGRLNSALEGHFADGILRARPNQNHWFVSESPVGSDRQRPWLRRLLVQLAFSAVILQAGSLPYVSQ